MLTIRFLRTGKKNQPFFRIVAVEKTSPPRSGKFLESLGFFNPLTKEIKINKERVIYWLSKGVKPSATVNNLLISEKIIQGKKIAVHAKSKKKEEVPSQNQPVPKEPEAKQENQGQ